MGGWGERAESSSFVLTMVKLRLAHEITNLLVTKESRGKVQDFEERGDSTLSLTFFGRQVGGGDFSYFIPECCAAKAVPENGIWFRQ